MEDKTVRAIIKNRELPRYEKCQKGVGKEQGREAYFTENVPNNLIGRL